MENFRAAVERAIFHSQVEAVIDAIRQGHTPRIGDILDHKLEVPGDRRRYGGITKRNARRDVYEFDVRAEHIVAAEKKLQAGILTKDSLSTCVFHPE